MRRTKIARGHYTIGKVIVDNGDEFEHGVFEVHTMDAATAAFVAAQILASYELRCWIFRDMKKTYVASHVLL